MKKYSKREKNRAKDFMHKLTTKIAEELSENGSGAVLENLKNIKSRVLCKSKSLNRKLSKWNARTFHFMLEYKLKWLGFPIKYVNPANSSKTCPVCSGRLSAYRGRLMKCPKCNLIQDRDVIAVLNLQMRGSGVTQSAPTAQTKGNDGETTGRPRLTLAHKSLPTVNPIAVLNLLRKYRISVGASSVHPESLSTKRGEDYPLQKKRKTTKVADSQNGWPSDVVHYDNDFSIFFHEALKG